MTNYDGRIAARADRETVERVGTVCEKYDMKESQVIRLLIRHGLATVEEQGIDGLVDSDDSADRAPATN
ncbi:hypothetical protein [Halostella pelagica]|uniref:hypothetical protein n=1 Tax=Halostella pelagica TaxID=2583824 RepID=UPI0010803B61|nr:hypothetical protein [Halostella pelagica]